MKVRFGYVAMAIDLKDASPSRTISFTNYEKIKDDEVKLYRLKKLTENNLKNTKRILLYNIAHHIKVYRLTSKIVPLVTHPDVLTWNYAVEFQNLLDEIKGLIKENNLRISAHPDHFTILASPNKNVVKTSIQDLVYHNNIMEGIGLDASYGKLVLHIGGKYTSKALAKERFKENFFQLQHDIEKRLILENDDKVYDAIDIIDLCEELNSPMVLDVHHHWCNNRGEKLKDYIKRIFNTWNHQPLVPKVHLSSPKSEKKYRAHADNIDYDFFYEFVNIAKKTDRNFDIMLEAKNKNLALFNLMKDIEERKDFKIINEAEIEI